MKILITILMVLQSTVATAEKLYPRGLTFIIGMNQGDISPLTDCVVQRVKDSAHLLFAGSKTPNLKPITSFQQDGSGIFVATLKHTKTGTLFIFFHARGAQLTECKALQKMVMGFVKTEFSNIKLELK